MAVHGLQRHWPGLAGLACGLALQAAAPAPAGAAGRQDLVQALLSEDVAEQVQRVRQLGFGDPDPIVPQALAAWRAGSVYLLETNATRVPCLLEAQTDTEGRARAVSLLDGSLLLDDRGQPLRFAAADLPAVDTTSKLRKALKTALDGFALQDPQPRVRRDAALTLGQEQDATQISRLRARLDIERDRTVQRALTEAIAITELASEDAALRLAAIRRLADQRSVNGLAFLQRLNEEARRDPARFGPDTLPALRVAVRDIETYLWWGALFGTAFRGLSLAAVLLVAALGLAITFGLMGVINMAHGEVMMVGAYTTYVIQELFQRWFGTGGIGFDCYFVVALGASFLTAGLVGLALECGIIRFLYRRPLESLLATWGVSLLLQQVFRHTFGAANVPVTSPRWLSGSFVVNDVLLAYNRLFVIACAVLIVGGTVLLLRRTALGLQMRAVMQNRAMAACVGVRAERVNRLTFVLGSGLAGVAGACLSQIGNVGPSLGQQHIVDCFMVVVLGGVGNLAGTVAAALGIGVTDQILQPWLGAVMGKITVLAAIILFLQWRPAGLLVTRSRSLEG